jgi:hypothetical protein
MPVGAWFEGEDCDRCLLPLGLRGGRGSIPLGAGREGRPEIDGWS